MAAIEITEQDFDTKVLQSPKAVLVDFHAVWCGPCKLAGPVLDQLSDEHKDQLDIVKVDVDKNPVVTQKYGVMSIPTTILFKGGAEVGRQVGFAGKQKFEDLISKA